MKTTENAVRDRKGFARLTLVIVLIFAVMGASIWAVSKKTSDDMADAAILNLNENLNLVESTVEAIQDSEAQFQRLLATELAAAGDPAAAVERLGKSDAAALISVVPEGADVGVSNDGHPLVKGYHRLLVWEIVKQPRALRLAGRVLDPLIGKSLVCYFHKPVDAS